jgi:Fe-S cluster biogenesis protein NfuA
MLRIVRRWFGTSPAPADHAAGSAAAGSVPPPAGHPTPAVRKERDALIREKVQRLLDTAINPAVAGHGGVVTLFDVRERMVYLQMGGGCQGCGMADVTLKQGIETMIREEVPEVVDIIDVTDHAAGQNPYVAAAKK